jgi:hypothetical protein
MTSVYEKWIAANHALFSCYEKVPADQYNALSKKEQDNLCKKEQDEVAAFLKNDSVNFRHIINERIAALSHSENHH